LNLREFIFIACMAFFSLVTIADDRLTMTMSAYEQGNYQTAHEQFTQLAHENNAKAQYNLAFMYFGGEGIPQDDIKAAFWFEQAAKLAHASAQVLAVV